MSGLCCRGDMLAYPAAEGHVWVCGGFVLMCMAHVATKGHGNLAFGLGTRGLVLTLVSNLSWRTNLSS